MRTSNRRPVLLSALAILSFAILAAGNEIVVLKGGKSLELSKPYLIKGSQAIMTLKDGTVISVPAGDVDKEATASARAKAAARSSGPAGAAALTPAEAAKAQKSAPKARVKLGDDDVTHGGYDDSTGEEGGSKGEGSLEVVDWNQTVNGETVVIKGTLRNTGKAVANDLRLSVSGKDDSGKVVATANADIAAGSMEPGASAGFTASLNSSVRLAGMRFVPSWTSPAPPKKETQEAQAAKKGPAAAAPRTAAETAPKQPAYTPNPSYAPPTPSAPTTAPADSHTGYIPGAHEEQPPPPSR